MRSAEPGADGQIQPEAEHVVVERDLEAAAETLGDYAFYGCTDLEDVTLGSTVEEIGGGVFAGCSKLSNVTVEDGNDNYMVENGMLLTKDGTTLVSAFGDETSVEVRSGVVTVEKGAFAGYATLSNVTLSVSVTTIGEAAFSNATHLAAATILSNVTTIAANAFFGTALATVYVSKGDTAHIRGLVEGTGYLAPVTYIELGDEPMVTEDWPDNSASVEGQTAEAAFGITGELATAKADDLATWAKAKGVDYSNREAIIPDAFLLDCANTPAAVAEATPFAVSHLLRCLRASACANAAKSSNQPFTIAHQSGVGAFPRDTFCQFANSLESGSQPKSSPVRALCALRWSSAGSFCDSLRR